MIINYQQAVIDALRIDAQVDVISDFINAHFKDFELSKNERWTFGLVIRNLGFERVFELVKLACKSFDNYQYIVVSVMDVCETEMDGDL